MSESGIMGKALKDSQQCSSFERMYAHLKNNLSNVENQSTTEYMQYEY